MAQWGILCANADEFRRHQREKEHTHATSLHRVLAQRHDVEIDARWVPRHDVLTNHLGRVG